MAERDDNGGLRLRVDRLAAAMDAARARARAAEVAGDAGDDPAAGPDGPGGPRPSGTAVAAPAPPAGGADAAPERPDAAGAPKPPAGTAAVGESGPGPLLLTPAYRRAASEDGDGPPRRSRDAEAVSSPSSACAAHPAPRPAPPSAPVSPTAPTAAPKPAPASTRAPATRPVDASAQRSSGGPARPDPAQAAALLSMTGVTVHGAHGPILRDVTVDVPRGAVTALLGPPGSGKTSVLRAIMGLAHPRARRGRIMLAGTPIDRWPTDRIARAGVGYVPQAAANFADLTVAENILLGARSGPVVRDRLDWLTGLFPPLAASWRAPAGDLPGGMRRVLALARALVDKRRVYLIDEPTAGLAAADTDSVIAALRDLRLQGASILLVVSDPVVARALGDAGVAMGRGRVIWTGSMADLAGPADLRARMTGMPAGDAAA